MASADTIHITVKGAGGHASSPHHSIDPILAAADVMDGLQAAITREVDVFDPAVLTFAKVRAGTTHNIIPETAELSGTLRCISDERREHMHGLIERVSSKIAEAHRCTVEHSYADGYPVTVNDETVADEFLDLSRSIVGEDKTFRPLNPIMGSEDWSYVLQEVPGVMAFVDANPEGVEDPPSNHSNLVVFNEDCMPSGVALYSAFAETSLANLA